MSGGAISACRAALAALHRKKVLPVVTLAILDMQQQLPRLLARYVRNPLGRRVGGRLSVTRVRQATTHQAPRPHFCQIASTFVSRVSLESMGSRIPLTSCVPAVPRGRFRRATIRELVRAALQVLLHPKQG